MQRNVGPINGNDVFFFIFLLSVIPYVEVVLFDLIVILN
jgi:hypothetical protein